MADYSKWDKIVDSDDELDKKQADPQVAPVDVEEREREVQTQEEVDRWLKRQIAKVVRKHEPPPGAPPELDDPVPIKQLTPEERRTLARFLVIAHHEKYDINIGKHHDIINVARQNRWLEEDPLTLQLLCHIHRSLLDNAGNKGMLSSEDKTMEDMLVSTINTLAAPSRAGCNEGYGKIFELFALIGAPQTSSAWDVRAKYMEKQYAADAILELAFPELPVDGADETSTGSRWYGVCLCFLIGVALMAALYLGFTYFGRGEATALTVPGAKPVLKLLKKDTGIGKSDGKPEL
mmetsp:Transcript_57453/g.162179  ORF Transcript_57453/g.162179 Transcript_57453/m.162179 type:complete len:292 (-) Transcript_57453:28-903(-)